MNSIPRVTNNLELKVASQDSFDVREFNVEDGLSSLFNVEVVAMCANSAVDFEEIIGMPAKLQIKVDALAYPGVVHPAWSGVVSELHHLRSEASGLSTYHFTIAPTLWLLTQRTNSRVYQQKTDLEIVKEILAEWDIAPMVECSSTYKTRKYRVQYQETDYAFICRLLEASGITFLFRQVDGESKLVLRDAPERGELRKNAIIHTNEPMAGGRFATGLRASRAVRSGKIVLADHDPRLPNTPLLGQAKTSEHPVESKLEHYAYVPGAFKFGGAGAADTPSADDRGRSRSDPNEAKRIAEQAGHARVARSQRFSFESNWLDLLPGHRVAIEGHPVAERHKELLLTRISLSGSSSSEIRVSCDAVIGGQPYRPEAVTPQPSIFGVECATVTGPAGETIHCDEFGRVRVQFHWDRYGKMNELSSCWVHVNQPWAGGGLGAINIPRIGQEVMVGFLNGNPEEPMIVGRMYTNLLRPPFALPANKTQNGFKSASVPATGGFNEFMFEDMAGKELVNTRAERDMKTRVNNDQSLSVGRHRGARVDGNDREHVQGNQKNSVFRNMMSAIGADQLTSVLGNMVSTTGKERILQTIGNFVSDALSHRINSKQGTTITVGKSMIHIGPDSIVIQTPKLFLNPGDDVARRAELSGQTPSPAESSS